MSVVPPGARCKKSPFFNEVISTAGCSVSIRTTWVCSVGPLRSWMREVTVTSRLVIMAGLAVARNVVLIVSANSRFLGVTKFQAYCVPPVQAPVTSAGVWLLPVRLPPVTFTRSLGRHNDSVFVTL